MNYTIKGGKKLSGSVTTNTSKNAAVALLSAALLNKGVTTLERMPRIEEVERLLEVLRSIGVEAKWNEKTLTLTPPDTFDLSSIDVEAAQKTRSSFLFIGALAHHLEKFVFPAPGGCKLGSRTLTTHVQVLNDLGVSLSETEEGYLVEKKGEPKSDITLYEASDTASELALITAALIPQQTTIRFATSNYMVQDTAVFLEELGVHVEGVGTTAMVVHGLERVEKKVVGSPSEDPIESMFFIALAATTGSSIEIKRCPIDFLEIELLRLERMGLQLERSDVYKGENGKVRLVDLRVLPSTLVAFDEKIAAQPYPGINIDNLPYFVPIATQAEGRTLIHDWVYENRAIYYTELSKLGADIVLADPHRVFVNGPTELQPKTIDAPPALRPATIILIGMLAAEGESQLNNVYPIGRGYENLHERLNVLGANITVSE